MDIFTDLWRAWEVLVNSNLWYAFFRWGTLLTGYAGVTLYTLFWVPFVVHDRWRMHNAGYTRR